MLINILKKIRKENIKYVNSCILVISIKLPKRVAIKAKPIKSKFSSRLNLVIKRAKKRPKIISIFMTGKNELSRINNDVIPAIKRLIKNLGGVDFFRVNTKKRQIKRDSA